MQATVVQRAVTETKKKTQKIKNNIIKKHFLKHVTSVKGIIYSRILLKRITTRRLMYLVTAAKVHQSIEKIVLKNNSFKMIFRNICTFLPLGFDPYHKMDKEYPQEGTNQAWAQKKPTTLPPLDPYGHQGNPQEPWALASQIPRTLDKPGMGPKKIPSHCPPGLPFLV